MKKFNVDKNAMRKACIIVGNKYWNKKNIQQLFFLLVMQPLYNILKYGKLEEGVAWAITNLTVLTLISIGLTKEYYELFKNGE